MGKFESVIEEYTFNRAKDCVRIGDRRTFSIFVSQFNIFFHIQHFEVRERED